MLPGVPVPLRFRPVPRMNGNGGEVGSASKLGGVRHRRAEIEFVNIDGDSSPPVLPGRPLGVEVRSLPSAERLVGRVGVNETFKSTASTALATVTPFASDG